MCEVRAPGHLKQRLSIYHKVTLRAEAPAQSIVSASIVSAVVLLAVSSMNLILHI